MAGRPSDPYSPYRMRKHIVNHYQYASTVSSRYQDGKRIRIYTHWGQLSNDLVFTPNLRFIMLPKESRDSFLYPEEWDISAVHELDSRIPQKDDDSGGPGDADQPDNPPLRDDERGGNDGVTQTKLPCGIVGTDPGFQNAPSKKGGYQDMLYGSVWFLMQLAEQKHIVDDLLVTFEYKEQVVNDILTLAIFPYLTRKNYDRLAHEQRIWHYPSEHVLTSPFITKFTQAITPQNRMDFFRLRIARQPKGAFLACDSSTRSAWGDCIAEIHYGRNKDNKELDCTLEVVVYSLTTHEPVYYRMFPGNEPDARTVRTIIADLRHLGVENLVTIFDRGYESADNFDDFFRNGMAFIACAKVAQKPVTDCLLLVRYDDGGLPVNLEFDPDSCLFYGQFQIENRQYTDSEGNLRTVEGGDYKCNIFLDPTRRPLELIEVRDGILREFSELHAKKMAGELAGREKDINKSIRYHKVGFDTDVATGKPIITITRDEKAIQKAKAQCGFFSSVSYKTPGNALEMLQAYRTRDEQEKYFEQMKDQMDFRTQDASSQDGRAGREFILFVGLILSSTVRNTWRRSVQFRKEFKTSLSILDEMADIRWIRYSDGEEHLTEFIGPQINICREFGIQVPLECLPSLERKAEQRKMNPGKRGRKPKDTPAPNKVTVLQC